MKLTILAFVIIDETMPNPQHGSWRALAGLFNEAWQHERKRLSRYGLVLGAIVVAGAVTVLATRPWAGAPAGVATTGRYEVCASNLDNLWRYTYGTGCSATYASSGRPYSYHDLIVPAHSTVDLAIARAPMGHSLRITGLGLTLRAATESMVRVSFQTHQAGATYSGQCVTVCGHDRGFAATNVIVVTPARYKAWLAAQRSAIAEQDEQDGQLRRQLVRQDVIASSSSQ
jgi:heme/copper-type cytochrome/quinol oxidase subunit 2